MDRQTETDLRYLRICREYAGLTRCLSRKVGALLTNHEGIVVGLGVNGPPRGIRHCSHLWECLQCGQVGFPDEVEGPCQGGNHRFQPLRICPRKRGNHRWECPAVHAEANALLACGRAHNSAVGGTLYIWPVGPCGRCAAQIIQAGISRLVVPRSKPYDTLGPRLLKEGRIQVVEYPHEQIHSLPD